MDEDYDPNKPENINKEIDRIANNEVDLYEEEDEDDILDMLSADEDDEGEMKFVER